MAINVHEFTGFNGKEGETVDSVEKTIDEKLQAAIDAAINQGQPQLQFRYEFPQISRRVKEEIRRRYEEAGWNVGWTNTETLDGIYLSAIVRDRRKR